MDITISLPQEFRHELKDLIREVIREELAIACENKAEPIKDADALLSRKEAMELIHCSHSTLYRYQKEGVVPYFKVGKKVLFKKGDLLEAIRILGSR